VTAGTVARQARRAASNPWVEGLARAGLTCRALVYAIVSLLALEVARGRTDKQADSRGALEAVARQPLGRVLLLAVAVGLAGYALWRFVEAALSRKWPRRLAGVGKGLVYVSLLTFAVRILLGGRTGGGGAKEVDLTARALKLPLGRPLVLAVGLVLVGAGLANWWRALARRYFDHLHVERMGPAERRWAARAAVVGLFARGAVLGLVGAYAVRAAARTDARQATGLDGALKRLAAQPFGPVLLLLVAAGLLAFSVYCLAQARYRRLWD